MKIGSVVYQDGESFFSELKRAYIAHARGLFILAPSGAGKTYFCTRQTDPHWIDGDDLWIASGAHPEGEWWLGGIETINRVDQRSDVITAEAKEQGLWIIGASNYWLKPDAIVIPNWDTHVAYIKEREEKHYDGGAKSDALDQVRSHIASIEKWHTDYDVPKFSSIDEATSALADQVL